MTGSAEAPTLRRRWLLLALFFALLAIPLSIAARGPGVLPGDVAVARAIQAPQWPWLDPLAEALSTLGRAWPGETPLTVAIVALIFFVGARRDAVFVAVAALAGSINVETKLIVASPRPTAPLVTIIEVASGSGFPSGHAFGATLLYGALWIVLPALVRDRLACRLLRVAAVVIALGIGWSRVRLGAHWPSDVLGGILWGLTLLAVLTALFLPGPLRSRAAGAASG
ncbi:MAG TPA: phosphatase PAP2 family protein [Thermomicrobiales bacterium]|nr:phosphatase PAP2 family protein [Thermomicrobiales bacterium]